MRDYKLAVFIGRFQPFHNSHQEVIKQGLEIADRVLVVVGSSHAARSIKNPFSYEQREAMIRFSQPRPAGVLVEGVRDYYYNTQFWLANVQAVVDKNSSPGDNIALIGSYKDSSSYYLNLFPQYDLKLVSTSDVHGTDVRDLLWAGAKNSYGTTMPDHEGKIKCNEQILWQIADKVPEGSFNLIKQFVRQEAYGTLAKENEFLEKYKESWKDAPFAPTFVTTDAVVTCSGHVLVVERGMNPGKGLFALPGGFLKQDEEIEDGMLRELREETRIRVSKQALSEKIVDSKVFDYPGRSSRGRTISHGYHIQLRDGSLPEVKGNDDAKRAFWMPLWDVVKNEDRFFEDHAHIINHFTNVGAQGER